MTHRLHLPPSALRCEATVSACPRSDLDTLRTEGSNQTQHALGHANISFHPSMLAPPVSGKPDPGAMIKRRTPGSPARRQSRTGHGRDGHKVAPEALRPIHRKRPCQKLAATSGGIRIDQGWRFAPHPKWFLSESERICQGGKCGKIRSCACRTAHGRGKILTQD